LSLLLRAVAGIKKIIGLVVPMFAGARDFASLGPGALWALRMLALVVTLVVLGVINVALGLRSLLKPPVNLTALGYVWLPLLFLLIYIFGWLALWLWKQLGPGRGEAASFPDIDRAWGEAMAALDRAGIRLVDTPLFLVLGKPRGSEAALFDAAELGLKVRNQPARDDAPVRVYANREAIYVTCAGASSLGLNAQVVEPVEEEPTVGDFEAVDEGAYFMTFGVSASAGIEAEARILAMARASGRGSDQLLEEEERALGRMAGNRGDEPSGLFTPGPVQDRASFELQETRLRHLSRLIVRDRQPYCPINGVLLLVPIASTANDHAATRVGLLCHRDLAAVRASMEVRCPVFALVPDLETLPGFGELIARLPEEERRRRMGQRFPLVPDVDPGLLPGIFDKGVNWIASKQFPARVDSLWRVESPARGLGMAEAVRGNIQLYQLLQKINRRLRRLGRVLTHAVMSDGKPSAMLGGCYLAGIGADPRTEQAFVPGVFRRLNENQDFVSWTPEKLAREAGDDLKILVGWLVLGIVILFTLGLVIFLRWGG
jgi:IcmF-related N-terminal domain